MEGAPRVPTPEVANKNEAPTSERELTPEVLAESIERATTLVESLKELDQVDEEGRPVPLSPEQWAKAKELSAELKETLKNIPAAECFANGLPYHPTDKKHEWPRAELPDEPDYPLSYDAKPGDGVLVDQQQEYAHDHLATG